MDALKGYNRRDNTPDFVKTVHQAPYPAIDPTKPSLSAAGKTVLITGGATGIGYSIARNFAAANASTIILLARRASTLETASAELSKKYPSTQVLIYAVDISNPQAVSSTYISATSTAKNHSIDILVLSAVYSHPQAAMLSILDSDLRASFETNIFGNLDLVRKFIALPSPSNHQKTILDVSSEAIFTSVPTTAGYGASKYGLTFLLRHIQADNPALRIHSFHPGAIWTPMVEKVGVKKSHVESLLDDEGLPGGFAVWLAGPEAEFLKGRMVFAKWDVEDLVRNRELFERDGKLATVSLKF
ncbi:NAD(P)-binding protein [Lindgomyces ingoldianus]|uniref:NAD(P)-binding protein n=1 Tax=Lindgomyces ingoldianus TaxID=673940 RepID=A0ACB6RB88_9PLEO|nr:NAD(P)-binding protein [Lindgomyces ingoldianus]KAF2476584.1 NAD(P)-binding protein [Lindgomyces ingoldianus]